MPEVIKNHRAQTDTVTACIDPVILKFPGIDVADYMDQVQVGIIPEPDQLPGVLVPIILRGNPTVVVPVVCVVGKLKRAFFERKPDDAMCIIGGGVDHVTDDLLGSAPLTVGAGGEFLPGERQQARFPKLQKTQKFQVVGFKFVHRETPFEKENVHGL